MTDVWPSRFTPTSLSVQIENVSRSGGVSLSGAEQVVSAASGRLAASGSIVVKNAADVRAWRAFISRRKGRAEPFLFPIFDCARATSGVLASYFVEAGGELTGFTDGTHFVEETATAVLAADAALRATSITVTTTAELDEGIWVGLGGDRVHLVETAEEVSADTWLLTVAPPLRAAYTAGAVVALALINCTMRLRSDSAGEIDLDLLRFARPNVELVEAL